MAEEPILSLRDVREAASALNELTDRTAVLVQELEDQLDSVSAGIPVKVLVRGGTATDRLYLEYRRSGPKGFRILVTHFNAKGLEISAKPWAECSRELKLEVARFFPALLTTLGSVIREKVADAEAACQCLVGVLNFDPSRRAKG
jgi:hypothetical protein